MPVGYKHRQQIRLGVLMPPALVDRLEVYVQSTEHSLTEVIRQAVVEFLDSH